MSRFIHFAAAIERIAASSRVLDDRLERLNDGPIVSEVAKSAAERAATELENLTAKEAPFPQPVDMLDEEWDQREIVSLREAVSTLALSAEQRPKDLQDWIRDTRLAIAGFAEARERFLDRVEF